MDSQYYSGDESPNRTSSCSSANSEKSRVTVAVIGLGFVGTQLVDIFSAYYNVLGYDISASRIEEVRRGSHQRKRVKLTTHAPDLSEASHFLIAVPTALQQGRNDIDVSHIATALQTVARYAHIGSTVVIESSVAVGMTRKLLGPLARSRKFFAGMSPERIDQGRSSPAARSIPKIVSGLDDVVPGSLDVITGLYEAVFATLVPVSKPEVAEMCKLYENCQRTVAIAYANEMADACTAFGIEPLDVAQVAASKPFGYLPVFPSLGVGGHCLPVNPFYLMSNCSMPLLQLANEMNMARPSTLAKRLLASLLGGDNAIRSTMRRYMILVVGVGYKSGQSHLDNSPGLQLLYNLMESRKVNVMFSDPLVGQAALPHIRRLHDKHWTPSALEKFDAIVVAVKQPGVDFGVLDNLRAVKIWQF